MDSLKIIVSLCVCVFFIGIKEVHSVTVRAYCTKVNTTYTAMFRLLKDQLEDDPITGLQAYRASVNLYNNETAIVATGDNCYTTTVMDNVYVLKFQFNESESTCGSNGTDIQIRAMGTSKFWLYSCANNALSRVISSSKLTTTFELEGEINFVNTLNVKFQAFEADGTNTPATRIQFGQDIKLRLILDTGEIDYEYLDNWGRIFHTAFLPHATATDTIIQIVTPGLGTDVHVTGDLAGHTLDIWVGVKRDKAAEIRIPKVYLESGANFLHWTVERRGIKIQALHDKIGVRVISEDGSGSSFTVLPDDVLDMDYDLIGLGPYMEGEILVVATRDDTMLEISYNMYWDKWGLKVNGTDVTSDALRTFITLNELEVLHIMCPISCSELVISTSESKRFAVIFGADNKAHFADEGGVGHVSTQLIPRNRYSNHYVLINSVALRYIAQFEPGSSTSYSDYNATDHQFDREFPFVTSQDSEHKVIDLSVGYYYHEEASVSGKDPALFPMPSILQWDWSYYFYVKEGSQYSLVLVGGTGRLKDIKFKTGSVTTSLVGSTIGEQPGFSTTVIQGATPTSSPNYERYNLTFTVVADTSYRLDQALLEFKADNPVHTFLMIIYEDKDSHRSAYLPFGLRYPCPCLFMDRDLPGDLLDNDGDYMVDEEYLNSKDDDGDGYIDEDLALVPNNQVYGIYVEELYFSDSPNWSFLIPIVFEGCYDKLNLSNDYSTLFTGPFSHNTNLTDEFEDYYVIESPPFNPARFTDQTDVYFLVKYGVCVGNFTRCEKPCISKRSTDESDNWIKLGLKIEKNGTLEDEKVEIADDDNNKQEKLHPCWTSPVFWVNSGIFVAILIVELGATWYFIHMKNRFQQVEQ